VSALVLGGTDQRLIEERRRPAYTLRVDEQRQIAQDILTRGTAILAEAETAGQPRLSELYDEAEDWRVPLRGMSAGPLQLAMWRAAHAVVMAVSAVFYEGPGDHTTDPFFVEKRNEAKVALDSLGQELQR